MPYRFRLQEPFDDGMRRIAREQLGRALGGFAAGKSRDAGIHDARRRLKKVRALLRLVRPALSDKTFKTWNWDLRDAGMLLSGARDLHVMETTLEELEGRAPARAKAAITAASRVVAEERAAAEKESNGEAVDEGVERVRASLQNIHNLESADLSLGDLARGLKSCYADCQEAFAEAYESGADEDFHEWRKTTQRHWRQLLLMQAGWRDFYEARATLAEEVSGLLGKDHDLAILKTFAAAHIGKGLTAKQSEAIFDVAQQRQDDLRAQAKPLATILLAAAPKALAAETKSIWEAARTQNVEAPRAAKKMPPKKSAKKESEGDGRDTSTEAADDDDGAMSERLT